MTRDRRRLGARVETAIKAGTPANLVLLGKNPRVQIGRSVQRHLNRCGVWRFCQSGSYVITAVTSLSGFWARRPGVRSFLPGERSGSRWLKLSRDVGRACLPSPKGRDGMASPGCGTRTEFGSRQTVGCPTPYTCPNGSCLAWFMGRNVHYQGVKVSPLGFQPRPDGQESRVYRANEATRCTACTKHSTTF